jgi:lysozyme family protein
VSNFTACLPIILANEGGFVDRPDDPGGPTAQGVTLATFQHWYPGATVDELKAITPEEVAHIYEQGYWLPSHADACPNGLDLCVFDAAVNCGPGRAVKWLQTAVEVMDDGIWGPRSQLALAALKPADTSTWGAISTMNVVRCCYYESLSRIFPQFINGWLARNDRIYGLAMTMAQHG